jgi:hypothetical protein
MGLPHREFGCGAASLMMLMRHHREHLPIPVPKYEDLCECLWLTVDPAIKGQDRKWGKGAYATDVKRALCGMTSIAKGPIKFTQIEDADAGRALRRIRTALRFGPVMVAMRGKGFGGSEGHWVVISGYQDGEIRYLDPLLSRSGQRRLPAARFSEHWDDCGFVLRYPCGCGSWM